MQQRSTADQHAGRAVAALRAAGSREGSLQGAGLGAIGQTLYGYDVSVAGFHGQIEAGHHRLAVDQDGAGAALAQLAAVLGPRQIHVFAEHLEQGLVRLEGYVMRLSVHPQLVQLLHDAFLSAGSPSFSSCRRISAAASRRADPSDSIRESSMVASMPTAQRR